MWLFGAAVGCVGGVVPAGAVLTAEGWRLDLDAADPFPDHRPAEPACPETSWGVEGEGIEVDTGACSYGQFVQPSRLDLLAGDVLRLTAWHHDLVAEEPGQGHLALCLDGQPLWERVVDIPAAAQSYDIELTVDRDLPAGSEVLLHLHNHGANTWTFHGLQRLEPSAETSP